MKKDDKGAAPRAAFVSPPPRTRPGTIPPETDAAPKQVAPQRSVKVVVNGKVKNRATGDHLEGYARPPISGQFKNGGAPGPGRPRGSKSQHTLMREALTEKRSVRVRGHDRMVPTREIVTKLLVSKALEGGKHGDLLRLYNEGAKLFPDPAPIDTREVEYDAAVDRQALLQLVAHLQLGEAIGEGVDPFANIATALSDQMHRAVRRVG